MYLIFWIVLLLQIVSATSNCTSLLIIEKCEHNHNCQVINQKCVNKWKHCEQIQQASVEKCKQFKCDYDKLLDSCKSYSNKSFIEQKIQESTNKKSFYKLRSHQTKFKNHKIYNQQETFSQLDLYNIKQQISEINNTQFEQLNFIINFAQTISFSCLIINLILQ